MLGAGFAYMLAQVKSFVQRQALIYGLMAAGGLILIFAAGYGLDAVREMLVTPVGGVYASLIVGGGLLVIALGCVGFALLLGRSPRPTTSERNASLNFPTLPRVPRVTGSAVLAGGAVAGLLAGVLAAKRPWRRGAEREIARSNDRLHRVPHR